MAMVLDGCKDGESTSAMGSAAAAGWRRGAMVSAGRAEHGNRMLCYALLR